MILITNNPKFKNDQRVEVLYLDCTYLEVLYKVRDFVHKNYEILTHPLYGNVTPKQTLYRSVLIKEGKILDFSSVELIEGAIEKVERIIKVERNLNLTEKIREDLEFIDYELIDTTLKQIL